MAEVVIEVPKSKFRQFVARLAHHVIARIHEEFLTKSKGNPDSTGYKWKPLSKATIMRRILRLEIEGMKQRMVEHKQAEWGKYFGVGLHIAVKKRLRKEKLQERERRKRKRRTKLWVEVERALERMKMKHPRGWLIATPEEKAFAAVYAWKRLRAAHGNKMPMRIEELAARRRPGLYDILIDTGRLVASLEPGTISGDEYVPVENQVYRFTEDGNGWLMELGTSVPYASEVSVERNIWPPGVGDWILQAAIQAAREVRHA